MKVKGTLVFTSEELEDIQRKAEKDNKFNASNPYEYVSYGVTAVLVYGVMSIFMPNVYLQARWLRIMMYTMEMFAALMLNIAITRKVFGRLGYIKCNKLWDSIPFMTLIDLTYKLEKILPGVEDKAVIRCKNKRAIIVEPCESGEVIATEMIKFPSNALMYRVFDGEYLNLELVSNEIRRVMSHEAYGYVTYLDGIRDKMLLR